MFETFSEAARRVIFFARFEAGRLACETIEPEHLVLGFIAEDQGSSQSYFARTLGLEPSVTGMEEKTGQHFLDAHTAAQLRERLSTQGTLPEPQPAHGDMMLNDPARQALAAAYAYADGSPVTPLHLLLGVLSNDANPATPLLIEHGVRMEVVKEAISGL